MFQRTIAIIVAAALVLTTIPLIFGWSYACELDGGAGCVLPTPLSEAGAATLGNEIYIFGGLAKGSGMQDSIMVYDVRANGLNTLMTKLPCKVSNPNAFALDGKIYVFGGQSEESGHLRNLTVFTPPSTLENYPDFFPYGVEGGAMAFDGKYLYVFGNCIESPCGQRNLTRIDLRNLTLEVTPNVMPNNTAGASAVWYKGSAYIFGGKTNGGRLFDSIRKYTPGKTLEVLSKHLPTPLMKFGLVQKGNYAYILGGMMQTNMSDQVLMIDLDTLYITISGTTLCQPRACRGVVGWGNNAYLVGGNTISGPAEGIEVVTLPIPEPPAEQMDIDMGSVILVAGITGSLVVILLTLIVIYGGKKE